MAEITVTGKVTYTYDTDDGLVTDIDSALDDVRDLIDSAGVSSQDFEFQTEVQGTLPTPDEDEEHVHIPIPVTQGTVCSVCGADLS